MANTLQEQTLAAFAFAGDLSMGQPPEHSPAVAVLGAWIAKEAGASERIVAETAQLGLIRWAGCTANAREFAELLGDDVRGRAEVLANRNPFVAAEPPKESIHGVSQTLTSAHCEAAILICGRLKLAPGVSTAMQDIFEKWDGSGLPFGRSEGSIAEAAQYISLAGDAEVFARSYGVSRAAVLIESRSGQNYEATLARSVARSLSAWTETLSNLDILTEALAFSRPALPTLDESADFTRTDAILLLADYADIKLPGHTGRGRAAAALAEAVGQAAGLPAPATKRLSEAAALANIGQVAVSNAAYGAGWIDREAAKLAPHWTGRILSRMAAISDTAALATQAYERLDGSGHSRGLMDVSLGREARLLQGIRAAVEVPDAFVAGKWSVARVGPALKAECDAGRLDAGCVAIVLQVLGANMPLMAPVPKSDLTPRETEVLSELITGRSNKEIARSMGLSPKTVGTHLERIYRKLGVTTRGAAALKALEAGLI